MTIADNLAAPIVATAAKAFSSSYDPEKPSLKVIFHYHWKHFINFISSKRPDITIRPIVFDEVDRLIHCGSIENGFEVYECPNCHNHHIICFTCKSRFCPSCGTKAVRARALKIAESTLDVKHRHIVFTIDERLRPYFKKYRHFLNFLFDASWNTLSYTFSKMARKNNSFTPGAIMTLHTYGRDLKWNPHMHCLLTEGGMNDDHVYKAIDYIDYHRLRKSFMKSLLDLMNDALEDTADYHNFKKLRKSLYNDDSNGFYVNAPPRNDTSPSGKKQVVQYIVRYAGKPAMAQSRITSYDYHSSLISYYYEDHKTNKRIEVKEHIYSFFLKLIQHIPERQFKMIRYYGIYATCDHCHKEAVKRKIHGYGFNKNWLNNSKHYRLSLIDTLGVDPLLCTCGHYMVYVDSYLPPKFKDWDTT